MLKKFNDFLAGLPMTIVAGVFLLLDLVPHLMEELGGYPAPLSFLPFDRRGSLSSSAVSLFCTWQYGGSSTIPASAKYRLPF